MLQPIICLVCPNVALWTANQTTGKCQAVKTFTVGGVMSGMSIPLSGRNVHAHAQQQNV